MSLLILEDLKKHYGAQEVLGGASLRIDPGDKIGLVGRNGGGKTTLLRIIAGKESPDWGSAQLRKGANLGNVPQRPEFGAGVSVRGHVETGLAEARAVLHELERTAERMSTASGDDLERLMREHDRLTHRVEELGGWDTERRIETVLSGIGLATDLWEREANTLSGGEKSRTALARELVGGHDILLLDEPTNHLDLEGIEWIERYLRELKGAVLIVSHDRRLLENAVDCIYELEHGQLTRYSGNYSRYVTLKQERFESDLRAWEQQQDVLRKEDTFIKKHMGSQRTAEAKGRQRRLSRVERLEKPHHDVRRPVIRPPQAARGGELVLETEGIVGGYGDNILFRDVVVRIGRGQRTGVVGPNGSGKSTLLKILAGTMQPLAGKVEAGHGSLAGYYDQDTSSLHDDGTPFTELRRTKPELNDQEVRSHLARFLFRGGDVDKPVANLSGGERARLALARLVLTQPSWLALDEPTNHLDLASRTSLEEMLGEYQGALLCISHDREFLDGMCNHILEVSPELGVREHRGNYTAWRRFKEEEQEAASEARARRQAEQKKAARKAKAADSPKANKKAKDGGRVRNPYMFDKLEKRIIALEEELEGARAACASEDVYREPDRLKEQQIRISELEHDLALANEEWENWE